MLPFCGTELRQYPSTYSICYRMSFLSHTSLDFRSLKFSIYFHPHIYDRMFTTRGCILFSIKRFSNYALRWQRFFSFFAYLGIIPGYVDFTDIGKSLLAYYYARPQFCLGLFMAPVHGLRTS